MAALRDLFNQYQKEIIPDVNRLLKKFNVSYILIEETVIPNIDMTKFSNINIVYQDRGFVIYKISMKDIN